MAGWLTRRSAGGSELTDVFTVFLPQLLLYPNPSDPLNANAAALLLKDKKAYEAHVRGKLEEGPNRVVVLDYVKKYALEDVSAPESTKETKKEPIVVQ